MSTAVMTEPIAGASPQWKALFRSGTAALLISTACYVAMTLLVYELLKPLTLWLLVRGVNVERWKNRGSVRRHRDGGETE